MRTLFLYEKCHREQSFFLSRSTDLQLLDLILFDFASVNIAFFLSSAEEAST